jgi:hypothetical protein
MNGLVPLLLVLLLPLCGCGDASRAQPADRGIAAGDTAPPPPPPWTPKPITARPDPLPAADSVTADSTAPTKSVKGVRPLVLTPTDSARWPVPGPAPLPGAMLPDHRIIAYYGNTRSTRMGILGQIPRDSMLARLEETAISWAKADTTRKVMPALHLIVTVAQAKPGPGGKYRLRMGDSVISQVATWAEERGWIMFLDVQTGHSTVEAELNPLLPFLARPYVHLALDPEFAMTQGGVPGRRIGTLDAKHVNYAIDVLAGLVDSLKLPPKVLIVHRFKQRMLTNYDQIKLDPRVQVLIQMDGFGTPKHKQDGYRRYIIPEPVQYTGFKLFYRNDRTPLARAPGYEPSCPAAVFRSIGCGDDGLMTPDQVLSGLYPAPLYIQYQ